LLASSKQLAGTCRTAIGRVTLLGGCSNSVFLPSDFYAVGAGDILLFCALSRSQRRYCTAGIWTTHVAMTASRPAARRVSLGTVRSMSSVSQARCHLWKCGTEGSDGVSRTESEMGCGCGLVERTERDL